MSNRLTVMRAGYGTAAKSWTKKCTDLSSYYTALSARVWMFPGSAGTGRTSVNREQEGLGERKVMHWRKTLQFLRTEVWAVLVLDLLMQWRETGTPLPEQNPVLVFASPRLHWLSPSVCAVTVGRHCTGTPVAWAPWTVSCFSHRSHRLMNDSNPNNRILIWPHSVLNESQ